jgi:multidrug transporter EmrE-like cation transporter
MSAKTLGCLVMSSVLNAALGFFIFAFALFATSPTMADVTMRVGFYVVNAIGVSAVAAVFLPWVFIRRKDTSKAVLFALLPAGLICLALLGFLTLDSWLNRTF